MCNKKDNYYFCILITSFKSLSFPKGGGINFNGSVLQLRYILFDLLALFSPFFVFTSLLCIRVFCSFLLCCFLSLSLCHQSGRILNRVFQATIVKELLLFIYLFTRTQMTSCTLNNYHTQMFSKN